MGARRVVSCGVLSARSTWSQRLQYRYRYPLFRSSVFGGHGWDGARAGRGRTRRTLLSLSLGSLFTLAPTVPCSSPYRPHGRVRALDLERREALEHSNFTVKVPYLLKIGRTLLYFRAGLNEDAGEHPLYVYITVPTAHVMYRSLHEPQAHAQSRRRLPFHSAPPSPGASRARRLVGACRRSRCAASPAAR